MTIRPGRNLVLAASGLVAVGLLTFANPAAAWALPLLAVPLAWLAGVDYRRLQRGLPQMHVRRRLPVVVGRDVPFRVELEIANRGSMPVAGLVRDVVPSATVPAIATERFALPPGGRENVGGLFRIPVRGRHEFGSVWLRLRGPYGLLEGQRAVGGSGSVKVLPEVFSSREGLRKDQLAEERLLDQLTRARQQGTGTDFESLAEYRLGDDPRRIDWRTTARQRRLIVRRFQIERHRDVMILVDCGRLMGADAGRGSKLDCAVDGALMLGRVALEGGDRCGLGLFDDDVLGYLPPISGPRALRSLTDCVYDAQSRWRESDFATMFATVQHRQPRRSLLIVLSDLADAQTTVRFRASLGRLARRHVVLFAALETPLLRQVVDERIDTILDGARKAVVFRVLREREQALHSLERMGVDVLDVEPDELTVPLINRFIELRRQDIL